MYFRIFGLSFIVTRHPLFRVQPPKKKLALVRVKIVAYVQDDTAESYGMTVLERSDTGERFEVKNIFGQLGDEFNYEVEL